MEKIKKYIYLAIALLLVVIFRQLNMTQIKEDLLLLPPVFLVLLIALQVFTQTIISLQWCTILEWNGMSLGFWKMLLINFRSSIVEAITPGAKIGGEAYKTVALKRELSCTMEKSASIVALQKMFSFFGLTSLAGFSGLYFFIINVDNGKNIGWVLGSLVMAAVLGLMIYSFLNPTAAGEKLKGKNKIGKIAKSFFISYGICVTNIKEKPFGVFKQLLMTFTMWMTYPVKLYIILLAFSIDISMLGVIAITFGAYVVGTLPVTPGGIGGFEMTMCGLLAMVSGVGLEQALVISVIFRFITFWLVVGSGIVLTGLEKMLLFKKEGLYD
ncbi:lysylphosphatidylglycerol synthase transmembrane domain-containing protein [Alkalibacter saccharofermentans]|uniref:Phosphatidylglycerol lysyltransferase n=1 Tax=Alkalibacter saccharofermentans DSM 14828 TaxID=1120975 RepID=A0A1M4VYP0_9FIRM|nr:lysylphosphatidylglycerol synthase transmembrane domain-containing protein [Alkalibacter saccharofermentans]SHE74098.1 hypothetical protein SAMN02746064_01104 [Alkalibacter saccharofermentans DSM 14828]